MKTLYHGTSSHNLDCIKSLGLVPGHAKGGDAWAKEHYMPTLAKLSKLREPSVFITDQANEAEDFARYSVEEIGGDPIIVTLHVPQELFATFVADELFEGRHAWRAHSISAEYVGEVLPVADGPSPGDLMAILAALMSPMGRVHR